VYRSYVAESRNTIKREKPAGKAKTAQEPRTG
jgi:hypothetical protein